MKSRLFPLLTVQVIGNGCLVTSTVGTVEGGGTSGTVSTSPWVRLFLSVPHPPRIRLDRRRFRTEVGPFEVGGTEEEEESG